MNEDNVIDGVINYLKDKNRHRDDFVVKKRASAKDREQGIDISAYCKSGGKQSNRYYIEAKGTLNSKDNSEKKTDFMVEFRWAVSQIVLDMKDFSKATVYGIAIPETEKERCVKLMKKSKGLKILGVRLYLAYKESNGEYYAKEIKPSEIYTK